jgi:putative endonuclease
MKDLFVYILTNERRTTLYIGVTNDVERRIWQHCHGEGSCFAKRYNLRVLIYYEVYPDASAALAREKQLKGWNRAKKEQLIATLNPEWSDLGATLFRRE